MDATSEEQQSRSQQLGRWLREAREAKSYTLADVEESTRIRRKFLAALESGDWEQLPSEVVGRGFLRNYATFLSLDPKEAIARLAGMAPAPSEPPLPVVEATEPASDEAVSQDKEEKTPVQTTPAKPKTIPAPVVEEAAEYGLLEEPLFEPKRVPWFRIIGILILVLILAAIGVASWAYWNNPQLLTYVGLLQPTDTPAPTVQPEPAVTRITATPTDTPTITPTPSYTATVRPSRTATTTPSATPTYRATPASGLELFLSAVDRCWLDVYTDGEKAFVGLLEQGEEAIFSADSEVRLTIGDASSLEVVLNGQPLGQMGEEGEILWLTWVLDGDQILQMSFTPTPVPGQDETPTEEPTTPVDTPTAES